MDTERNNLIENSYYLGTTDIRNEVVWRDGLLVTVESAEAEDARIAKSKLEKEAKKALEEGTSDGLKTESESEQLNDSTLLIPAPLTFVGLISPHDFWFMSDANWSGPTEFTKTFAEVKLNGRAIAPTNTTPFADDFSTVLQNMEWFMKTNETLGYAKQGIFQAKDQNESIKLRHALFEQTDNTAEDSDPQDVESMENWPIQPEHIEAKAQLDAMKYTYRALPLPAYDIQGRVIPPEEYLTALKGAVVRVTVHLKHWAIANKNYRGGRDTYTADVENLRVLVAAPKLEGHPKSVPEKRKLPQTDPGAPSKKKVRTGA
ncbi:hypothetical protein C8R45DRAFT_519999 [Mycena sanguinolenta]|nr:hypothetical protein C8R45DRAFT_519999 [Mycena sanguinolenta]